MEENKRNPAQMLVNNLEEKVKDNTVTVDDFNNAFDEMQRVKFKLQQLLEYKMVSGGEKEYGELYKTISGQNFSDLVDKLNHTGYVLIEKNKDLADLFKKNSYRIMEQARAGKRDDVFHSLLRIFMSLNIAFPKHLLSAFKQTDTEMFRVLVYSFLSGIVKKQQ